MDEQFLLAEAPQKEREWVRLLDSWPYYQLGHYAIPAQIIPMYVENAQRIVFASNFKEETRPDIIRLVRNLPSELDQDVFSRAIEEVKRAHIDSAMRRAYAHLLLGSNGYLRAVGMPHIIERGGVHILEFPVAGLTYGLSFLAAQNFKVTTIEALRAKGYAVAPLGVHVVYLYEGAKHPMGNLHIAFRRRGPRNALYNYAWEGGISSHIDWMKHFATPRTASRRTRLSPFEATRDRIGREYFVESANLRPTFIGVAVNLITKRVDLIGYVVGPKPTDGNFELNSRPSTRAIVSCPFTPMNVARFISGRKAHEWIPVSLVAIAEVLKHYAKFAPTEIQVAFRTFRRRRLDFNPHPGRCESLQYSQ